LPIQDGSVRNTSSLQILLVMITAGGISQAMAQGRPSVTMSLFGAAPTATPKGEIKGMRPETVGRVAYFSLSDDASSGLMAHSSTTRRMQIALPGGGSVTCAFRTERRPGGMLLLTGTPEGGGPGESCNLVVNNGQVTGEVELASGRYRIQPLGDGSAHAIVEVKTEQFPNENPPKQPPR
jgi:hypothetical protein